MNSKIILALYTALLLALGGCATMSSDECMTSDWSTIGFEDGARGYTADRIGQHRKACAKHGVTPDFTDYQTGRDQGLQQYCQPSRGFTVGSNGGSYNGVCSIEMEGSFLDAYNTGYHLYTLRSNVNRANSDIHARERELDRIADTVRRKERELIGDETTTQDRILLLADLKDLSEETGQLEAEIRELYDIRARSQVELEHYQTSVADLGY